MSGDTGPRPSRMGRTARVLGMLTAAAFVALLAYGLTSRAPDTTIDDALVRAQTVRAPDFELDVLRSGRQPPRLRRVVERAVADGPVALRELRGGPVVLNFWASWCVPCRTEAAVLERGWATDRQDVLFVGLNIQDVREDAREFLDEFGVSYLNVREGDKATARRYGATGLPETFFISARGEVVFHVIGAISAAQLAEGTAAARVGRPAGSSEGGDRRPTR